MSGTLSSQTSLLVVHVSPGGVGSFRLVLRISSPTLDDLKVLLQSFDPVPNSGESIKERVSLPSAMEICPLDFERLFKGVLDGQWELG